MAPSGGIGQSWTHRRSGTRPSPRGPCARRGRGRPRPRRAAVDPEPPAPERVREQGEDGAVAAPEVEDEVIGRDAREPGRREHALGRGRVHQRKVGLQLPEACVVHHPCVDTPSPINPRRSPVGLPGNVVDANVYYMSLRSRAALLERIRQGGGEMEQRAADRRASLSTARPGNTYEMLDCGGGASAVWARQAVLAVAPLLGSAAPRDALAGRDRPLSGSARRRSRP